MDTAANQEQESEPVHERNRSGFGLAITIGTTIAAGVAMVALLGALHVAMPLIAVAVGGLSLLGGGLLIAQHHKEAVNEENMRKTYAQTPGYHKEKELVKGRDRSLLDLIKGHDDLPERVQYIKDNYGEYGIKPLSANQFRGKYLGTGLTLGLVVGAAVMAGLAALTVGTFGAPAFAFAGVMGALAGGTTLAAHTAHTMTRYDKYVDDLAAKGEAKKKAAEEAAAAPAVEYDNGCGRTRTFCEDVIASRQQRGPAEVCH